MSTRQTTQPLPDHRLSASNRTAREIARGLVPQMDLNPPYQRGTVWTNDQRIALVKSWIMGVPIPAIILNCRDNPQWEGAKAYEDGHIWAVVDGKQRIETAVAWFAGELAVPESWFPADRVESSVNTDDGPYVTYADLSVPAQRLMGNHAMLPLVEAQLPSVQAEASLYVLVNGGGTAQSAADMARAAQVASEA